MGTWEKSDLSFCPASRKWYNARMNIFPQKSFFIMLIGALPLTTFASSGDDVGLIDTYEKYTQAVQDICESPDVPWADYKNSTTFTTLRPEYPALSGATIAERWTEQPSQTQDVYLQNMIEQALDTTDIDGSVFTSVRLAGVQYRTIMDQIYACGIIEGRIQVIERLEDQIDRNNNGMTEIRTKLETMREALQEESTTHSCKSIDMNGIDTKREILDATLYQYCVYRHYLAYVETNMEVQMNTLISTEQEARKNLGVSQVTLQNTDQLIFLFENATSQIQNEITRAKDVYSQAFVAYGEMERTYGIHILLLVLTDDYIQFRENLKNFMNPLSQFFQKAVNAQSKNPPPM